MFLPSSSKSIPHWPSQSVVHTELNGTLWVPDSVALSVCFTGE